MSDLQDSISPAMAVSVIVVAVLLLSGPGSSIDFTEDRASLGEGNASVTVVQPRGETIPVTDGRFGTNVSYVRIPDLVVDVKSTHGNPRVYYQVTIPEEGIRKQNERIVTSTGRLRVPISDRAVPRGRAIDGAEARLVVRVQSYGGGHVVLNRTVEVRAR